MKDFQAINKINGKAGAVGVNVLVLVAAVGFIGFNALFALNEWEQAVVVQFGDIKGDPVTQAGLHFKVPFIQQVQIYDKRLMRWDGPETTTITKDRKTILVNVTARWRIKDAKAFRQTVGSPERMTTILNGILQGAVRDEIARYDLYEVVRSSNRILEMDSEELITSLVDEDADVDAEDMDLTTLGGSTPALSVDRQGQYQAGRPVVLAGILEEGRARLGQTGTGVELEDILIKQLNYSSAIEANVYAQMNAELQKISAGFRSIGRQRAEQRLGEMERELATIQSQAIEASERIRGEAEAEAINIYADAYNRDPEFYQFLRTLQAYETTLSKNTALIIGTDSPLYELLKR
jgi:modulator of FtsH protease HflC